MNKLKTNIDKGEHPFSIEMASKAHLGKIELSDGPKGQVLIEGKLGRDVSVEFVEDIMFQITGENGVFRIDLSKGDLKGVLKSTKTLRIQHNHGDGY